MDDKMIKESMLSYLKNKKNDLNAEQLIE